MGQPSHEECTPNSHQEWSVPGADLCWSLFVVDALIYDSVVVVAHKPECLSNVVRQLGLAVCAYEQMSDRLEPYIQFTFSQQNVLNVSAQNV